MLENLQKLRRTSQEPPCGQEHPFCPVRLSIVFFKTIQKIIHSDMKEYNQITRIPPQTPQTIETNQKTSTT